MLSRRLLTLALAFSVSGCATIIHGSAQDVGLSSTPSGAKVTIDGHEIGSTPVFAKLSRKDNHTVHFALDGYQPMDLTLTRGVSGWVCGNLVFGMLPGLVIDAISGGIYKLSPDQLSATLGKSTARADGKTLVVAIVMHADSTWQRIGTLTPAGK